LTSEKRPFGNLIDFSVGDFVTVSDGDANLGSNPTVIITDIDLERSSVKTIYQKRSVCSYPEEGISIHKTESG